MARTEVILIRVTPEVKTRLEERAAASGDSISLIVSKHLERIQKEPAK